MSAVRGAVITAAGNIFPAIALLVIQVVLARGLGVIGRGEVAAATAPLLFATVLLSLSLPETLTFYVARVGGREIGRQFGCSLITLSASGCIGMLLIAGLAGPLSAGNTQLAELIVLASGALLPALLKGALRGVAFGAQQWWLVMAERMLSAAAQMIALVALYVSGKLTPTAATVAIAVGSFIGAGVYLIAPGWWRILRGQPRAEGTDSRPLLGFASYAWLSWIGSVSGIILLQLDQVIMTPLAGVEELGIYVVAANIASAALLLNSAVGQVIFSLESGNPNPARVGRATRATTAVTVFVAVCLASTLPWTVPLLFGLEFTRSIPVAMILLGEICLSVPGSIAGTVLSARGRPGLRSLALAVSTVVYIVAMFLLVPKFGAIGAAVAMIAATLLPGYLAIYFLCTIFKFPLKEFYQFRASDLTLLKWSGRQKGESQS